MMENGMQESRNGSAPLKDVDKATFARFAEYIYSGDYNPDEPVESSSTWDVRSVVESERDCTPPLAAVQEQFVDDSAEPEPEPEIPSPPEIPSAPEPEPPTEQSPWDGWNFGNSRSAYSGSKLKKKNKKAADWPGLFDRPDSDEQGTEVPRSSKQNKLLSPTYDILTTSPVPTSSMFVPKEDWTLDYLPTFMSHAQLYVFADVYAVTKLQRLAARRLDEALSLFVYSASSPTNVSTLIRYVYDRTAERKGSTDILRTIVANFAANNMHALQKTKHFRELLVDGGPFSKDFVDKVCVKYPK
jgi:hypothetical protein